MALGKRCLDDVEAGSADSGGDKPAFIDLDSVSDLATKLKLIHDLTVVVPPDEYSVRKRSKRDWKEEESEEEEESDEEEEEEPEEEQRPDDPSQKKNQRSDPDNEEEEESEEEELDEEEDEKEKEMREKAREESMRRQQEQIQEILELYNPNRVKLCDCCGYREIPAGGSFLEHSLQSSKFALAHYNKDIKLGHKFVFCDVIGCSPIMEFNLRDFAHLNFRAKSSEDGEPKLFFAELLFDEGLPRVLHCCILEDDKTIGGFKRVGFTEKDGLERFERCLGCSRHIKHPSKGIKYYAGHSNSIGVYGWLWKTRAHT